jgi:hypothetical protein
MLVISNTRYQDTMTRRMFESLPTEVVSAIKKNFPGFENAVTLLQKKSVLSVPLNTLKPL